MTPLRLPFISQQSSRGVYYLLRKGKVCSSRTGSDGHLVSPGDFRASSDYGGRSCGRTLVHSFRDCARFRDSRGAVLRSVHIPENLIGEHLQDGGTDRSGSGSPSLGDGAPYVSKVRAVGQSLLNILGLCVLVDNTLTVELELSRCCATSESASTKNAFIIADRGDAALLVTRTRSSWTV